jgi:hypothetical protein
MSGVLRAMHIHDCEHEVANAECKNDYLRMLQTPLFWGRLGPTGSLNMRFDVVEKVTWLSQI